MASPARPGDWSRLRATGDRSCFRLARARFSVVSMGLPLLGVLLSGLLSSLVALRAVSRAPLLAALRAESIAAGSRLAASVPGLRRCFEQRYDFWRR